MAGQTDVCVCGWTDGLVDVWMKGWMEGQINVGWKNKRMDGRKDG